MLQRIPQLLSLLATGAALVLVTGAIGIVKALSWLIPAHHVVAAKARLGAQRRLGTTRVMFAALLLAVSAASGYYLYRYPVHPQGGPSPQHPKPASVDAGSAPPPAVSAAKGIPVTLDGNAPTSSEFASELSRPVSAGDLSSQSDTDVKTPAGAGGDAADPPPRGQPAITLQSQSSTNMPLARESDAIATSTGMQRPSPARTTSRSPSVSPVNPFAGVSPKSPATDARISAVPVQTPDLCTDARGALGLCDENRSTESSMNAPLLVPSRTPPPENAIKGGGPVQAIPGPAMATTPRPSSGAPPVSNVSGATVRVAPDGSTPVCMRAVAALGLCNSITSGQQSNAAGRPE